MGSGLEALEKAKEACQYGGQQQSQAILDMRLLHRVGKQAQPLPERVVDEGLA